MPIGSERYSSKHHADKYHRLYQDYGIVGQITYVSQVPIPHVIFATRLRSLRVIFVDRKSGDLLDSSPQMKLDYPLYMRSTITEPIKSNETERSFPPLSEQKPQLVTLSSLGVEDLRWGFWQVEEGSTKPCPAKLLVEVAGIDVTKGKLLLILEREGNQPLEVELPQK